MKDCGLTDESIEQVVKQKLEIIEVLDLSQNKITDKGCEHLSQILLENKQIKELNLSHNSDIGRDGFRVLTKSIKKNTHLQVLSLQHCSIDLQQRYESILEDITMNCTLITLNLQGNNISDKFMHILENELSQNQSIQDIILPSIKEKGLKRNKYVAEKKRTMTKLEQVEVLPSANANITRHKTHKEVRNRA